MKLIAVEGWMIGRIAITKMPGLIQAPDPTKGVTKFALIESVSDKAHAAGFRVGDLVMAKTMHNLFLKGGTLHRVTFPVDEAVCIVRDVPLSEFVSSDGKPLDETLADKSGAAAHA